MASPSEAEETSESHREVKIEEAKDEVSLPPGMLFLRSSKSNHGIVHADYEKIPLILNSSALPIDC